MILAFFVCLIATFVCLVLFADAGEPGFGLAFLVPFCLTIAFGVTCSQPISTTNIPTPGTIVKTPNAVIVEIRVGDRIERATFTDIATYQRATPETPIIWRVTENSWGKSGVIVLDLP
jgi:hypothetical protein